MPFSTASKETILDEKQGVAGRVATKGFSNFLTVIGSSPSAVSEEILVPCLNGGHAYGFVFRMFPFL